MVESLAEPPAEAGPIQFVWEDGNGQRTALISTTTSTTKEPVIGGRIGTPPNSAPHRILTLHPPNGSVTRMVSSRSGLVLSSVTGVFVSSSTRRIYFTALAGRSAQLRAP